ncbi:MAG: response regulator [Anaerolineae bacterium]|nr:response regulator [Anaerolineae bacterium]
MNGQEKPTILIIDDNPFNLTFLIEYLRHSGFKTVLVDKSQDALTRAKETAPDIILLDVLMPEISGFDICLQLKDDEQTAGIPVIFISALSSPTDKIKGFQVGGVDYLTKPVQSEETLVRINTHLTVSKLQKQLEQQNKDLQEENTRRRRVQDALQESRERYRILAENSTDMISRQTLDGTYRYVSPACASLLGYKIEEIIGRPAAEFIHPDDLQAVRDVEQAQGDKPRVWTVTYRAQRKDQSYIWVETINRVMYDEKHNLPLEIIAVSRDITERKEAEAALEEARNKLEQRVAERTMELAEANAILKDEIAERKRAEQEIQAYSEELKAKNETLSRLDKLKDEFLANTSHELRTPLNGITGIAESMIDGATGELTQEQLYNLSMIVTSGRRLTRLVNDTLDFSKLKHQEMQLVLKAVDLNVVTDVVLTLSKPLTDKKSLNLINELDPKLPPVLADEARVQQIMHNLIGNAIKFTDQGSITIYAEAEAEVVAITVTDSGIGIPADEIDTVFQSFKQVDASDTRTYGGTGLGLSIAKHLVELHGGTISVESTNGEGTRFTFTLPRYQPSDHPDPPQPEADETDPALIMVEPEIESLQFSTSQALNENNDFTILVVDDELINVQVLVNYLSMQNYGVVQAFDGVEALNTLEATSPDLVLLDVMMPKMSGYEVCRKLRERYPAHEMPVVLLTAKNQTADLITGFEAGANDYLTKPFDKNELLARVKTHLRLAKISNAYGRFVPHEFLRFLNKESIVEVNLGDQIQRKMSILFSDIRSFTSMSENMSPDENFRFLNEYLSRVSPIIRQNSGFIDKYIGDAMMSLFPECAQNAVEAAVAMQQVVSRFNQENRRRNIAPIDIGVGVHTGNLMLGTIGETRRMEGTVISDAVNLAARLEGLTKQYGASILISENTLYDLDQITHFSFRFLDRVQVKGKHESVSIFEILDGSPQDVIDLKLETRTNFEKGLLHYHSKEFAEAKAYFDGVLALNGNDKAVHLYLNRINHFLEYGVPADWEGIVALSEK